MNRWKYFFVWLFIFWVENALQAQPESYKFTHLNVNQGLSHNQVTCFFKDKKGFLWIGTLSGLNRFDGYSIKVFLNDSQDSSSLPSNSISKLFELPDHTMGILTGAGFSVYDYKKETFQSNGADLLKKFYIHPDSLHDVIKDNAGNYWFLHTRSGLVRVDGKNGQVSSFLNGRDSAGIAPQAIKAIVQNRNGAYWLIHANGLLEKAVFKNNAIQVNKRVYINLKNKNVLLDYHMIVDSDDDLWICTLNDNQGVYYFNTKTNTFRHIDHESKGIKLNTNIVSGIVQDNKGVLWIGTDHGGLNLIDKKNFTIQYLAHQDEDEKSLAQNSIDVLYRDNEGIVWVGTFKHGVSYYHENIIRFPLYHHYPLDRSGLPYSDVNRFVEDAKGNLWIGTNGGGLIYFDRSNNTFKQYKNNPADKNSLSSNVIVSLLIDSENILWIGTYYGGLNAFDGNKFVRYENDPADPGSIASRSIWEIFEDAHHRLWIGTLDAGLDLFDRKSKTFSHYRSGDVNSVQSSYISAITEDNAGNLWVGTGLGVDVFLRKTGRFVHYENEKGNRESLSDNGVLDIKQDSKGRIWIGTYSGLNLFDEKTLKFKVFKESDGLPHNSILTLLEDNSGNLWMSTPNGLSNMIFSNDSMHAFHYKFKNYDEADGLQGKQFNENATLKTLHGELIFGGANGFNIFKPENLGVNKNPPQVVLLDFQLFNKSIKPEEDVDGQVVLHQSVSEASQIILPADKNVFSIEFAALNYFHPEKNEYKYKLEGFNADWLSSDGTSRTVTFTNLNPGDYVFKVKAANNDGYWNEEGASIKITVLPPFWKTRVAFMLYVILIIGSLLVIRTLIQQREQMKFAIRQERQEALRMHELDMMKIKFFTNVSHEFRTPLTLILTPIEKLLRQVNDHPEWENQFQMIQRNARRLLNLVNQLLDFRKLEVQELRFNPSEGDIIDFIKETVYSFSDVSEKKDISLTFTTSVNALETIFDQDKLEKILFNLLSNAFKFTPEHGAVKVTILQERVAQETWLSIEVQDTGIGIDESKQEQIFERFFQNELPKSMVNQGSGIGLAITKEFVRIHRGIISVSSQPGIGSRFIVRLPIHEVSGLSKDHAHDVILPQEVLVEGESETEGGLKARPVLLLVEDNEDFRFYIKDNLKQDYKIIEAKDGVEGWAQVIAQLPDLIVSDVMMPNMNGIDLCRKVKTDQRFSHIPIILLTARTAEEQKLEGFDAGTNEYITKPFNFEILVSRIKNLIHERENFQKSFSKQLNVKASELHITSLDEKFIKDAIESVEKHIDATEFSVEDLSHALGISRAHLYKKVQSLTGKSPLEFIRTIRLQQAAQLLQRSQLTVAEVAYKVGFNNPKYFAKYFKEQYGMLPSVYAAKHKKEGASS